MIKNHFTPKTCQFSVRLEMVNRCEAAIVQPRKSAAFTSFPGYPDQFGRRTYNRLIQFLLSFLEIMEH